MKIGFWGDVYQATSYSVDISEVVIETKDVDFNVVNLEGVICDFDICNGIEKTGPILRCDSSVLDNLENMKVRLISLANNHAGDYGSEGINQTCIHLQKKSINYIGVGCDIEESYRAFRVEDRTLQIVIVSSLSFLDIDPSNLL